MRNGGGAVDSDALCHRGLAQCKQACRQLVRTANTDETGPVQWRINNIRQNSSKSEMSRYVLVVKGAFLWKTDENLLALDNKCGGQEIAVVEFGSCSITRPKPGPACRGTCRRSIC
jgi:hypothetical protein